MKPNQITLADRCRNARRAARLTQRELSELTAGRLSASTLQKIEIGKVKYPHEIHALAEALEVNPAWLLFGEPYAPRTIPNEAHA